RFGLGVTEVNLVDDGQDGNFKKNGIQPRPLNDNFQLPWPLLNFNVFFLEFEVRQIVNKIFLKNSLIVNFQFIQITDFFKGKSYGTKFFNFFLNLLSIGTQIYILASALKGIFHLGITELMKNRLHHGELIKVRIQQRSDDAHGVIIVLFDYLATYFLL